MIYLRELRKACNDKPLIVVDCSGSALAIPEVHDLADAIIWAWYPGEQGGNAVADVLFGDISPSGKLPASVYSSTDQLADFKDYNISGSKQTYRYFQGDILYPFGFGLHYTTFKYNVSAVDVPFLTPVSTLKGFQRVYLKSGEKKKVLFRLKKKDLEIYDDNGEVYKEIYELKICVGSALPNARARRLGAPESQSTLFLVDYRNQ